MGAVTGFQKSLNKNTKQTQRRTLNSLSRSEMESRSVEETHCLPEQVISEEILTRLPVKSLLKFRCVSKSWCSLIGSKRFIKAHLKRSIKSPRFPNDCMFVSYAGKNSVQCSNTISQIAVLGIKESDRILPVGYCNGLVCILVNWKRFILWNPTTKKFNNLPDFYNQIKVKCGPIGMYGFGFDELSDDYKVFGMTNRVNEEGCIGMIYSLRGNSWKHIEEGNDGYPFDFKNIHPCMGMYVSGKLNWNTYIGEIVSLDLNSNVCGVFELPSYAEGVCRSLGTVRGCLSAHFCRPNSGSDVWVMKEYGVKESWDKVMTIPSYVHLHIPAPNRDFFLICYFNVIYTLKCDVVRHPEMTELVDRVASVRSMGIYVESLVSVAPDSQ